MQVNGESVSSNMDLTGLFLYGGAKQIEIVSSASGMIEGLGNLTTQA